VTQSAVIKLGRLYDGQPLQAGWAPAEKTLFQRGAFRLLHSTAPLLVNHCHDRQVGDVLELDEFQDTGGPWLVARCRVDAPPAWELHEAAEAILSHGGLEIPRCAEAPP
jgi:hypothetical protein